MEYTREEEKKREPRQRLNHWNEYTEPLSDFASARQGARCMDCGTPFCHMGIELNGLTSGCPIHNLIPEWNDLVYRGRWKEALERLLMTNNFPEFTGRVCPAPCEGSCTVAISGQAVAIKSIERAIIDKGFEEGWIQPRVPAKRTGKKIAVVGSGPAGLTCADELNQRGHSVTVYERADRVGGLLIYGIPNMKLDKRLVERRVRLLEQEGITFMTNTEIGKDIAPDKLRSKYDAVVLCTGSLKQRELNIEGSNLNGVQLAMDYLTLSTKGLLDGETSVHEIHAYDKNVIVIGGGDTGADCVATALRQKCKSVVQFGKHPKLPNERTEDNPWPQFPLVYSLDYAYEEAKAQFGADPRQYCIQTKKIIGDENGNVKELHTVQMEKIIENGDVNFREIPGTEKVWPCELVLVAIGFEGPEQPVLQQFGVKTVNQKIKAKFGDFRTNVEGVFAAGDARRGQSLVVWAIREGREVAKAVNKYLLEKVQID